MIPSGQVEYKASLYTNTLISHNTLTTDSWREKHQSSVGCCKIRMLHVGQNVMLMGGNDTNRGPTAVCSILSFDN